MSRWTGPTFLSRGRAIHNLTLILNIKICELDERTLRKVVNGHSDKLRTIASSQGFKKHQKVLETISTKKKTRNPKTNPADQKTIKIPKSKPNSELHSISLCLSFSYFTKQKNKSDIQVQEQTKTSKWRKNVKNIFRSMHLKCAVFL